jgi:hypothetical protein
MRIEIARAASRPDGGAASLRSAVIASATAANTDVEAGFSSMTSAHQDSPSSYSAAMASVPIGSLATGSSSALTSGSWSMPMLCSPCRSSGQSPSRSEAGRSMKRTSAPCATAQRAA